MPGREDLAVRFAIGMDGMILRLNPRSIIPIERIFCRKDRTRRKWTVTEHLGEKRVRADLGHHLHASGVGTFRTEAFSLDSETMNRLQGIYYTRCIALLGLLDKPSSLSAPGTLTHPVAEVDWVSDNQIKGVSEKPAFTLHASDSYSQRFWDSPDEQRCPFLIGIAEQTLGTKVTRWSSHRWGFAKPVVTFGATHFHSPDHSLTLAGDGFGGERIENAFLSGWEAAKAIMGQNRNR